VLRVRRCAAEYQVKVHDHDQQHAGAERADGEVDVVKERVAHRRRGIAQGVGVPHLFVFAVVHARRRVGHPLIRSLIVLVRKRARQRDDERQQQRANDAKHVQRIPDLLEGGRREVEKRQELKDWHTENVPLEA
jgi:hypothetical protein